MEETFAELRCFRCLWSFQPSPDLFEALEMDLDHLELLSDGMMRTHQAVAHPETCTEEEINAWMKVANVLGDASLFTE